MNKLTDKMIEKLPNMSAFNINFPDYEVLTYKPYYGKRMFYIVPIESRDPWHEYIYHADNLNEINGYLYGAVQVACKRLIPTTPETFRKLLLGG